MNKYSKQLNKNFSTACAKLRKLVMFDLICRLQLDVCYRCKCKIESAEELSLDHKVVWRNEANAEELFYDLDNITFSHKKCNTDASRSRIRSECGTVSKYYAHQCRCEKCKKAHSDYNKDLRKRKREKVT